MPPEVKNPNELFVISPKADTLTVCGQAIVGGTVSTHAVTRTGHVWLVQSPVWSQIVKQIES